MLNNKKRWLAAILIIGVLAIAFFWGGDYQKSTNKLAEGNTEMGVVSDGDASHNSASPQDEDADRVAEATSESDKKATELKTDDVNKSEDHTAQIEQETDKKEKDTEVEKAVEIGAETKSDTVVGTDKLVKEAEKPVVKVGEAEKAGSKQPVTAPATKSDDQEPTKSSTSKSPTSKSETHKESKKDKYLTDPVPAGKPEPVEWQDVTINKKEELTVTLSVTATTILNNMDKLNKDKLEVLPADGVIYKQQKVTFYEGESVFDVLLREMKKNKIHMEFTMTPIYNSNYVEGINNLYEFDCGELSGWMYKVNGWFPNYGASRYVLHDGDVVDWVYTCDLGRDIGGYMAVTGEGK